MTVAIRFDASLNGKQRGGEWPVESGGSGEEIERVDVSGSDDPEVASVEGGDDCLVEAFSNGNNGCVGGIEPDIGIGVEQLGDTSPVDWGEIDDADIACGECFVESRLGCDVELAANQPPGFSDHQRSSDERSRVSFDQRSTTVVVPVIKVSGSNEHAGINKQHVQGVLAVRRVGTEPALFEQLFSFSAATTASRTASTHETQGAPLRPEPGRDRLGRCLTTNLFERASCRWLMELTVWAWS